MILSTLTFTEIEFPAVDLTNAGISRLIDCQLVSGLTATSLAAPAIVFRSRIMLRPLVSVPPSAGKRASSREVSPTCWATSDSSLVLSARAEVAGPAAVIRSVMVWFLASSWSASGQLRQRGRDLVGPGIQRPEQLVGLADHVPECLALVAGRLAEAVVDVGEIAHRAAVHQHRRRAEHRFDRRGRRGGVRPMVSPFFSRGAS